MRKLLLATLVLLTTVELRAAISVTEEQSASGNDATITFATAPTSGQIVWIFVALADEASTASITGWTPAVTTVRGPLDSPGINKRTYVFCTAGDGADTTMVVTTAGTTSAQSYALVTDAPCSSTLDDFETTDTTATTSHALSPALTTTVTGDLIVGLIACDTGITVSTRTTGGDTIGTPGASSEAHWLIDADAPGTQNVTWTTAASETCWLYGAAILESAGGGGSPACGRAMRGFGCEENTWVSLLHF